MIFYGRNVTKEALSSNFHCTYLYIQKEIRIDEKLSEIIALAKQRKLTVQYRSLSELNSLTRSHEHQGVAVDVEFHYTKLDSSTIENTGNDSYIYIYDVTYEHNLGAIIRSAEISGLKGVIIPKEVSITPVVARTSAGAIFHIPIVKEAVFNVIKKFKKSAYKVISIERGGQHYFNTDMTGNCLFIIGGEDKSVSQPIIEKSDLLATIPQYGNVNSLNMSVATGIILFERVRQIS